MRTLNVRLAATLAGVLVTFCIGVYFLHNYQVWRNADVFKREADKARARMEEAEKGDDDAAVAKAFRDCAKNLNWYIRLRPDDTDTVQELGMLLTKRMNDSRTFSQAFGLLESVLRSDPTRKNIREKLVEMAIDHSCRDAVARLIAWRVSQGLSPCSADTGAYCTARSDLSEEALHALVRETDKQIDPCAVA